MSKVDNEGLRQAIMAAVKQASRRLAERRTPLHLEYDFHFIECLDIVKLLTLAPV
jgi:hypothetical protein